MRKFIFTLVALMAAAIPLLAQPVITAQPTNQIVFGGSNVIFTVAVSGTGPFAYQWQFNGANLTNNIINIVAGGGTGGAGGPATNANISYPYGVAVDAVGNLYVANSTGNLIWKVDTNGIINTVAGNGNAGFTGDGGPATNASLSFPDGMALDPSGQLFITDYSNSRIRKVDTNGVITTVAGNGTNGYSGDGGPATNASLFYPADLALDAAGNLFIADYNNARIRRVDTNGIITTVAGNGTNGYSGDGGTATDATLDGPYGLTFDSAGNLYIGEQVNGCIRKVDTNGVISTVASGGFNEPDGVAADPAGNIYVADSVNNWIKKVDTNGIITYVTASDYPVSVATDRAGNLFIGDTYSSTVREIHYGGFPTLPLTNAETNNDGAYDVIITDSSGSVTSSVAVLSVVFSPSLAAQPASQVVPVGSNATFSVVASGSPPFTYQWFFNGATLDGQTNGALSLSNVTTNESGSYSVLVSNPYGSITSQVATLVVAGLPVFVSQPSNQAVLAGNRSVISADVSGIGPLTFQWQLNGTNLPNNIITTIAGNGTAGFAGDGGLGTTGEVYAPYGVAADNKGNVFIADSNNNRIRRLDTNGLITTVAGNGIARFSGDGGAATNAGLDAPREAIVDSAGNMFVADYLNNRVRKVDTDGVITTVAGNGTASYSGDGAAATNASLYLPQGLAMDNDGNLFIADTGNNRIRKVDTNGIITTVAGTASIGFSGDGGLATNADLSSPRGVALDGNGNLLIADSNNHRVRKVDPYGVITTIAGNGSSAYSGDRGMATNAALVPYGVAVDAFSDLLIADQYNNRIRQVDPYGIITTVAGTNGPGGFAGDGGPAINARLYSPLGVALDSYGRTLTADTSNNRIRRFGQGPTLVLDKATAANAGNYTLVINGSYGSVTSSVATLTVWLPPAIVNPPVNQTAGLGSNATFAVTATGTAPLGYQWLFNGTNLLSQGGQSLNLTNVQWSDGGNYSVIITNNYGSVTSAIVTLTVGIPPTLASQPTNLVLATGSTGLLSIGAAGDGPFSYQWQFNGTNLPPVIITVAGTNGAGFSGDGGPATAARLNLPEGVAVDAAGNVFIADRSNNRIRKVAPNGIITTVAGNGTQGNGGNGGAATNATLASPEGMTCDSYGNLYFVEYNNGDVRELGTNGIISRVAGTGGVGVSNDGGQATNTSFYYPSDVALGSNGVMYLAESTHCRIRAIGTNGIVTTAAGDTVLVTGGFSGDGGPATNAQLNTPNGIAVDQTGNLWIADTSNQRIRKVDTNGIITTVAGGGSSNVLQGVPATNAYLNSPYGALLDNQGNLFFTDSYLDTVRKMDATGILTTVAGNDRYGVSGDGGPAINANLGTPMGIAFDTQGNLFIADENNNRIRKVCFSGLPTWYLLNPGTNNTGVYSVIVSSPFGSIASSNVTVTIINPPVVGPALVNADGSVSLNLFGTPNLSSRLYAATNLVPPVVWIPISTNPAGGAWQFTDTNGSLNPARFYRASTP